MFQISSGKVVQGYQELDRDYSDGQEERKILLTSSARKIGRPIIEGKMEVGKFCPAYPTLTKPVPLSQTMHGYLEQSISCMAQYKLHKNKFSYHTS